jgi:hypothetical protein
MLINRLAAAVRSCFSIVACKLTEADIQSFIQAFMIDFYADNNGDIPKHIGFCHILPSNLKDTVGSLTVSITSLRQEPIGQVTGNNSHMSILIIICTQ